MDVGLGVVGAGVILVGSDVGLDVGLGVVIVGTFVGLVAVIEGLFGWVHIPRVETWFHILALTWRGLLDTVPARGEFE